MIKKILFVFGLAITLQLISGCVDCNCEPTKKLYYTKNSLSLKNLDASLTGSVVTEPNVISSANYGIQIQFLVKYNVLRKQRINWSLIQTAQACDCAMDEFIAKENISSVEIFSNNDFDSTHPKNTDLSSYFKVKRYGSMIPIADYLKSLNSFNYFQGSSFYEGIFLQVAPSNSKKHKFSVKITLSDGRVLEAETAEVELI